MGMPGQSPLSMMRPSGRDARGKAAAGRPPRRRWSILTPLAIVIALAGIWVGLWYYAAAIADRTLAGWVEREAAAGRLYACGRETIGGFPLGIGRIAPISRQQSRTLSRPLPSRRTQ